jgi:signal peptidase
MASTASRAIKLLGVLAVLLLVAQAVGQPLLLSYVRTGSMEPAIGAGDGFITLPAAATGPPAEGDVIVYRAEQVNQGGLTTHRVVDETDRGYITRGDANPFTDQSAGEPPVRDPQIVAVALQLGGDVVVLPAFGTAVTAIRGAASGVVQRLGLPVDARSPSLWLGLATAGLILLLFSDEQEPASPGREDTSAGSESPTLQPRALVLLAGAVVVALATASMVLPLGPTEYPVVSADAELPGPRVIAAGESEATTYRVPSGSLLSTRYYVQPASEGVSVQNGSGTAPPGTIQNVTVTLSAPPETGYYRRYVRSNQYPVVVPVGMIDTLYATHPLAPVVLLDTLVAIPFLTAAQFVGRRRPRAKPGVTARNS